MNAEPAAQHDAYRRERWDRMQVKRRSGVPTLPDCPVCKTKSLVGGEIDRDGYITEPVCEYGCVLSEEDLADIRLSTEYEYRQYVADHVSTRGR